MVLKGLDLCLESGLGLVSTWGHGKSKVGWIMDGSPSTWEATYTFLLLFDVLFLFVTLNTIYFKVHVWLHFLIGSCVVHHNHKDLALYMLALYMLACKLLFVFCSCSCGGVILDLFNDCSYIGLNV